jgi:recX family
MIQKKQIGEAEALRKLGDLCARGEHCSGEMAEKLRKWGIAADAQERIIDKLIDYKYIDNERFTRSFVRDKIAFNKWGRRKIEQALWQKRIPQSISQSILDEIEPEEYLNVLRPLLKSKYPSIKGETDYERSIKLIKYAMGRGFTLDLIRQCIDDASIVDDINEE